MYDIISNDDESLMSITYNIVHTLIVQVYDRQKMHRISLSIIFSENI